VNWVREGSKPSLAWNVPGNWQDYDPTEVWESVVDYLEGDLKVSRGHQISNLGKTGDVGGPFEVVKRAYEHRSSLGDEPKHFSIHHEFGNPYYADPMAPGGTHHYFVPHAKQEHVAFWSDAFEMPEVSTPFQLDGFGTTAISRMIPTNPVAGLASFLGELREGLPKFGVDSWKHRTGRARSAGGDYLNVVFGWKPLVSDIKSFASTARNADRITKKYEAESGKLIHRRYDFPLISEVTYSEHDGKYPSPLWDYDLFRPDHVGVLQHFRRTTIKRWCSAAFTYHLPPVGSTARDLAIANKLYGIRLTPDVAWQLTPWSWAADWVTNFGDIESNVSAFMSDGLVMPYAYIMEESKVENEFQLSQVGYKSYPGMHTFTQKFTTTVKSRRKATPFGFGLKYDDFTSRQLAIIVALGLSKSQSD
jgi:hypothetical protein